MSCHSADDRPDKGNYGVPQTNELKRGSHGGRWEAFGLNRLDRSLELNASCPL